MQPGMSVSYVARRSGRRSQLAVQLGVDECWKAACRADSGLTKMSSGTSRVRELERRVRELERLLGRKTMEAEILKEALDVARVKRPRTCNCHHGTIGRTVRHEGGGRHARGRPFEPDRAGEPPRQVT